MVLLFYRRLERVLICWWCRYAPRLAAKASPIISFLFHLSGADPNKALKRAEKALDHWRSVLKDQWNIHGLMSSQGYGQDGLPWATSHYSFHLVLWHLPLALSGQKYSAPESSLEFWPKFPIPFELPFFTPQASGTLRGSYKTTHGKDEEMFSLKVTSGKSRDHWWSREGRNSTWLEKSWRNR